MASGGRKRLELVVVRVGRPKNNERRDPRKKKNAAPPAVSEGQTARRRLLMALATFIAWFRVRGDTHTSGLVAHQRIQHFTPRLVRVRGDGAVDDSLEAGHRDLGDHLIIN